VQTRPSHSNRSTVVEVRRARDEQRRVHGPPYTTDLGNVGIYVKVNTRDYHLRRADYI
jgi:hypothetical protein